jgi:hypothetical protein
MIKFELFSIHCIASNINWQAKTVSISHNIKYFMVNIEHYSFHDNVSNEVSNDTDLKLPFTYSDVSRYWFENINKYSKLYNINFSDLKIGIDYSIAPIYVSRNKTQSQNKSQDNIIIGIFLLNNDNIDYATIKSNATKTFNFLSNVSNSIKNKYKIFSGILDYQNENQKNHNNHNNKTNNDAINDKCIIVDICCNNNNKYTKYKITMQQILTNACNYLPKIDITLIKNKILQGSFKIS